LLDSPQICYLLALWTAIFLYPAVFPPTPCCTTPAPPWSPLKSTHPRLIRAAPVLLTFRLALASLRCTIPAHPPPSPSDFRRRLLPPRAARTAAAVRIKNSARLASPNPRPLLDSSIPRHPAMIRALAARFALDRGGGVYFFEVPPDAVKIGRSINPPRRRTQWRRKCRGQRQFWWGYWDVPEPAKLGASFHPYLGALTNPGQRLSSTSISVLRGRGFYPPSAFFAARDTRNFSTTPLVAALTTLSTWSNITLDFWAGKLSGMSLFVLLITRVSFFYRVSM
jgi:hypothetical protein